MAEENELNCQTCGACCAHFFNEPLDDLGIKGQGMYIGDGDQDVSQLPQALVVIEPYPELGTADIWLRGTRVDGRWRCMALAGKIGGMCGCAIYDDRPQTCRAFERGSEECLKIRKKFKIR